MMSDYNLLLPTTCNFGRHCEHKNRTSRILSWDLGVDECPDCGAFMHWGNDGCDEDWIHRF